jgi:hypothetical protein
MIKYLFLISLLALTACSSVHKTSIFDLAKNTQYSNIKSIKATNEDEARRVLQGRYNYLTLMFEQSRDPYYGHPKWTESCLQGNKIGFISKVKDPVMSVSELYVDDKGNPGFCPESLFAIKAYEIYFYCEQDNSVYQVTLPLDKAIDLNKVSLCK